MRVVFDTNVLLAGVFTRGLCEALLDACLGSDEHTVVVCEYILEEFARTAQAKFGVPADEATGAVASLRAHVEVVDPTAVPPDACRDRDDLPVLGTLMGGRADCLVTGDRDLLDLKIFGGFPIVSPRGLYDRLA